MRPKQAALLWLWCCTVPMTAGALVPSTLALHRPHRFPTQLRMSTESKDEHEEEEANPIVKKQPIENSDPVPTTLTSKIELQLYNEQIKSYESHIETLKSDLESSHRLIRERNEKIVKLERTRRRLEEQVLQQAGNVGSARDVGGGGGVSAVDTVKRLEQKIKSLEYERERMARRISKFDDELREKTEKVRDEMTDHYVEARLRWAREKVELANTAESKSRKMSEKMERMKEQLGMYEEERRSLRKLTWLCLKRLGGVLLFWRRGRTEKDEEDKEERAVVYI